MKHIKNNCLKKLTLLFILFTSTIFNASCEDFLEVEPPISEIPFDTVFEDENLANATVANMYTKLRDDILFSGMFNGNGIIMGLYSDELDYYATPGNPLESFYNHTILPNNQVVKSVWDGCYNLIYASNSFLEGISNSTTLDTETINRLMGEALFIRAVCHFYLTNFFGNVPYIISTHHIENQNVSRTDSEIIYQNIIEDLILSKSLLTEQYHIEDKIRANKYVISAFLARVYLYHEDWALAMEESSQVINASSLYSLEQDINLEFNKNSTSTILQLKPGVEGLNTWEGMILNFTSPPNNFALNPEIYESMENEDLRKNNWISIVTDGDNVWYANTKYKENSFTGTTIEYAKVLRLSEQYLIRAEALARLGNLSQAKEDLNAIRFRAGLQASIAQTQDDLLNEILQEKRSEFFAEQGHRWFDLVRFNKAEEVLIPIKPNWRNTDFLLPIPEIELLNNPNLLPQNPGY
ncbi:RagB/SusD family nutrient uptake outer membrane protein [Moheibacter sp.]|uniref:RagB/SusD family nutrient uptake outer membrane protein n=1 Tax=Moheibacter sp. TaxID=1965316 RepID=UPI003C7723AC